MWSFSILSYHRRNKRFVFLTKGQFQHNYLRSHLYLFPATYLFLWSRISMAAILGMRQCYFRLAIPISKEYWVKDRVLKGKSRDCWCEQLSDYLGCKPRAKGLLVSLKHQGPLSRSIRWETRLGKALWTLLKIIIFSYLALKEEGALCFRKGRMSASRLSHRVWDLPSPGASFSLWSAND